MIIHWHKRFTPYQISSEAILLISEKETLYLSGIEYSFIIEAIETETSIYNLASITIHDNAHVLFTVKNLIKQRILVEKVNDSQSIDNTYIQLNYTTDIVKESLSLNIDLYNLTEYRNIKEKLRYLEVCSIDEPLTIVVVDDYLDPRLDMVEQELKARGKKWVLLKITGEQGIVGPLFTKSGSESACWHCVKEQMLYNQPARRFISQKRGSIEPVPIKLDERNIAIISARLQNSLNELIEKRQENIVITFDIVGMILQTHNARKIPQCKKCGDENILKNQINEPIQINSYKSIQSYDGGLRIVSPQDTVDRLLPLVDSVTGISPICISMSDNEDNNKYLTIYKTAFFKTPSKINSVVIDPFLAICLGKGVDPIQSQASALCEAFERYNAHWQGDEPTVYATSSELNLPAIMPDELTPLSERQFEGFSQLSLNNPIKKHGVEPYSEGTSLHWTKVWSLTENTFSYMPTTYCFANTPYDNEELFCRWGSNGCAAGNTLEEAILQGLFELLERDAIGIWWYNKVHRPEISLSLLSQEKQNIFENELSSQWNYWVLDLTNDTSIPVAAAIGQHKNSGKFIMGFGSHINSIIAVERALTELCQLIPIRDQSVKIFNFDDIQEESFLYPHNIESVTDHIIESTDLKEIIDSSVTKLNKLGLRTYVLNYSRPDIPLHTVNVTVPGLCHMWPQFANRRLYEVPMKMDWLEKEKTEEELNPLHLYI